MRSPFLPVILTCLYCTSFHIMPLQDEVATESHIENPHNVTIYIPCHYDLSEAERVAPLLAQFGGKVFLYKWYLVHSYLTLYRDSLLIRIQGMLHTRNLPNSIKITQMLRSILSPLQKLSNKQLKRPESILCFY